MSHRVIVEKEAEEDIKFAVQWIARHSPEKATLWYFDLLESIESLENFPARCPIAPESTKFGFEIRHLIFGKHRLLFIIDEEEVYLLRLRHQAQDTLEPDNDE